MGEPVRQQGEYADYSGASTRGGRSPGLIWALRIGGIAAALTVWHLLGRTGNLEMDARCVAAVATLMAIW